MLPALLTLLVADTRLDDLTFLTKGVTSVNRPGVPGNVVMTNPNAVAFVVGQTGNGDRAVMAGARYGQGRMVAMAHGGWLQSLPASKTILTNAVRWAGGGGFPDVGVFSDEAEKVVPQLGLKAKRLRDGEIGGQVMIVEEHADPIKVREWIARGGGVVALACPWGWAQLHPGRSLSDDFSLNKILEPSGIVFGGDYTEDARVVKDLATSDGLNAAVALETLTSKKTGSELVVEAVRALSAGSPFSVRVKALVDANAQSAIPTEATPFGQDRPFERLALVLNRKMGSVAPSAKDFPGEVPATAPRLKTSATIDTTVPQWHTFGVYAAPGDKIKVRIPKSLLNAGPRLRIGLHVDENWPLAQWTRHPAVTLDMPIVQEETEVSSPFGGLVAIELGRPAPGKAKIDMENVVESPRFVLGSTTPAQWKRQQALGAPWAEIVSKHLILTVPTASIQKLDDPKPVAEFWDELLEMYGKFDTRGTFGRPERIVADRQIVVGYMHAGYPIMTHLDAVDLSLSVDRLRKEGSWGHFHELGHNRQLEWWTFDGTGEVTNNLYTLRAMQLFAGQGIFSRLDKEPGKYADYKKRGAKFEEWKGDAFLALSMYAQLIDAFGWEALTDVFGSYQKSPASELPKTEEEKRDQWMVRYAKRVRRNLGPFFVAWGVPTSEAARKEIADLPAWMPEGWK
ncbi:hypothetical protein EON79_01110 [bacterium]|nr:MAG: hypothetical protein EON79_01110 [bacterium]